MMYFTWHLVTGEVKFFMEEYEAQRWVNNMADWSRPQKSTVVASYD